MNYLRQSSHVIENNMATDVVLETTMVRTNPHRY
jgi:hypothetical protein